MKRQLCITVDAPEDATHYTGDLLSEVTWWRFSADDQVPVWCYAEAKPEGWVWLRQGAHAPHRLQPLPLAPEQLPLQLGD